MSQNDDTDDHDVRGESMSTTTRRGLLGALGVAGLASLGSSGASANLGGGPEAGAMTDYQVPFFRVPESDLDTPGVVGRRVEITSGGGTYSAGDQLVDLGDRWGLVSPNFGSVNADDLNNVKWIRPTGGSGVGADAPPGSDPWTFDESRLSDEPGQYRFTTGRWITSGIVAPSSPDYNNGAFYIVGDGFDDTVIEHEDGSSPTIKIDPDSSGQGSGVKDANVYGAGNGTGSANIIETSSTVFDTQFNNIIARYGGGDAIHVNSAAGTRVFNCYAESVPGDGLYLSGGNRGKVVGLHAIGCGEWGVHNDGCDDTALYGLTLDGDNGGLKNDADRCNIFVEKTRSGTGVKNTGSYNTGVVNAYESGQALVDSGKGNEWTIIARGNNAADGALHFQGSQTRVPAAYIEDWGGGTAGRFGCRVDTEDSFFNIQADQTNSFTENLLSVESNAARNTINLSATTSEPWIIEINNGAVDTDLRLGKNLLQTAVLTDNGTRTMVNGRYYNGAYIDLGGDPGTISPVDNPLHTYNYRIDGDSTSAGGDVLLQGVKSIIGEGRVLIITQTGDTNIEIQDTSSNGVTGGSFRLRGESDFKLSNGETAMFVCDASNKWAEIRRPLSPASFSTTNDSVVTSIDANNTTTEELADYVATLKGVLVSNGVLQE